MWNTHTSFTGLVHLKIYILPNSRQVAAAKLRPHLWPCRWVHEEDETFAASAVCEQWLRWAGVSGMPSWQFKKYRNWYLQELESRAEHWYLQGSFMLGLQKPCLSSCMWVRRSLGVTSICSQTPGRCPVCVSWCTLALAWQCLMEGYYSSKPLLRNNGSSHQTSLFHTFQARPAVFISKLWAAERGI